jgi:hypothetical protein
MTKVVFDISIALDGFMTAANQTPDEPMGPVGYASLTGRSPAMSRTARSSRKVSSRRAR